LYHQHGSIAQWPVIQQIWLSSPAKFPTWNPSEALLIQATIVESPMSSTSGYNPTILPPTDDIHILIDRSAYSSYTKLIDVTAYALRFVYNTREKLIKLTGPLTPSELSIANLRWVGNAQVSQRK